MDRRYSLLLCTGCALLPLFSLFASTPPLNPSSDAFLQVSKTSLEHTTISLNSPDISIGTESVGYERFQAFSLAGEPSIPEDGGPTLPQVTRFYRIPNTGSVDLVIEDAEYEVMENVNPLPYHEKGGANATRKSDVYTRDAWYPAEVAQISAPMQMRDFRVVTVTLYPVQVNPVTHQARVYHTLNVSVNANNQPGTNEITRPRRPSGAWAAIYRSQIANLDDNALDDMTTTPGSLLILTSNNSTPLPWADSLAERKTRMGYKVTIDARAAWTTTMAITSIRTAYANAPYDHPLEFVVLMGDPGATWGIPLDNTYSSFDHTYALANTGDDIEDIGVGRLSGSTASTLAVINAKIMGYERSPHVESSPGVADTMWFHKAFLYAGVARDSPDNYLMMRWAKQQFVANTGVDSVDILTHSTDAIVQTEVTTRLSAGVGFFFWQGTWLGGMPVATPNNCNSGWRLPICVTMAEDAGDYSGEGVSGPAEGFLCDGTVTYPKGGVCGIGTSSSGVEYTANVYLTSGLLYNITDLMIEHLGTAVVGAKAQLYYAYPPGWPDPEGYALGIVAKHVRLFNLLGDPSLSMWTDVPKALSVTHPISLNIGAHSVDVTVQQAADGAAVEGALVCLWKKGPDSTWVTGLTDGSGHITLPVSVNTAGDMFLTVTKHNIKPYLVGSEKSFR
jgi:hypothetical protein